MSGEQEQGTKARRDPYQFKIPKNWTMNRIRVSRNSVGKRIVKKSSTTRDKEEKRR